MNENMKTIINESAEQSVPHPAFRVREAMVILVLAVCLAFAYFSPLAEHLTHLREVNDYLAGLGSMAVLVFIGGATILVAIGIPRMAMYPIAGIAFGFWGGLVWTTIAVIVGGYAVFCYARWGGRTYIVGKWPRMARVARYFGDRSFRTVALLRLLPAPGFLTNLFLGITHIRHRSFLLGTAIGSVPPAIPATLLGSSAVQVDRNTQILHISLALAALILLWSVVSVYVRNSPHIRRIREGLAEDSAPPEGSR